MYFFLILLNFINISNERTFFITFNRVFILYYVIVFTYFLFKLVIKFLINNKFINFLVTKYKTFKIFKLIYC